MKKLLAFDLDGTLAPSKSLIPNKVAELLNNLLNHFEVCIISGGKYELFQKQVVSQITKDPKLLKNLHLMPTSGTRYYNFDETSNKWVQVYTEDLSNEQKRKIIRALNEALDEAGYKIEKTYGEQIEDRDSQVTLSILGQDIVEQLGEKGLKIKESWDKDGSKKMHIRNLTVKKIPEFEVRASGATSIDVTKPGIDKAYGMEKLMVIRKLRKIDVLFFGDKIIEGGNDYAVYQMGIDCISVRNWEDTAYALEGIYKVI